MLNFNFSYLNLAIIILIFLISLFLTFIYQANLQIKYQKVKVNHPNSALKQMQNIFKSKQEKVYIKFNNHYLKSPIKFNQKIINLNYQKAIGVSIYDQVNVIFLAYKYLLAKNKSQKIINYQGLFNCFMAFFAFNFCWALIFSFYIIVMISGICWLMFIVINILAHYPLDKRAIALTIKFLTPIVGDNNIKMLKSYAKYLACDCFFQIAQVYPLTLKSIIISFRNWGQDE